MDPDPFLLFDDIWEDPIHFVESLPLTYDIRFADVDDEIRRRVYYLAGVVSFAGRVDLVEKLINGGYVGVNEVFCIRTTLPLLGVANTTEMADLLISHGAVFRGREFDCFDHYIRRYETHMIEYFFNHPEFIYREEYMNIVNRTGHGLTWEPMRGLLKRKRNRQYAAITMSALADRYRTDVYVHLTPLVESFL